MKRRPRIPKEISTRGRRREEPSAYGSEGGADFGSPIDTGDQGTLGEPEEGGRLRRMWRRLRRPRTVAH